MTGDTKFSGAMSNDIKSVNSALTGDSKNYFDYWALVESLDELLETLDQYTIIDGNYGNITNDIKYG